MLFGSIGIGYIVYGRKQKNLVSFLSGIALISFPYFVSDTLALSAIILIALGHIILGPYTEVLLGSNISEASMLDPTVDSQNRFYGTVFSLFGVLLILCSRNFLANKTILYCVFWVFFAGGIVRLVSISSVGMPPLLVNVLTGIELVLPLMLIVWLRTLEKKYGPVSA